MPSACASCVLRPASCVLRPAPGGQYTGSGTSPAETIQAAGISTFSVSMPVKAGDLLGLDNDSSALLFDTANTAPLTAYYEPALTDGRTAAPDHTQPVSQLLLSAIVQASGSTTTGGTTTVPITTTPGNTIAPIPGATATGPKVTRLSQSDQTWHEQAKSANGSGGPKGPIGTTFSVTLNEAARVSLTFDQQLGGRKVRGACVKPNHSNRLHATCTLLVKRGSMSFAGRQGANKVPFQGRLSSTKKLSAGHYTLLISATSSTRRRSATARLTFTILP